MLDHQRITRTSKLNLEAVRVAKHKANAIELMRESYGADILKIKHLQNIVRERHRREEDLLDGVLNDKMDHIRREVSVCVTTCVTACVTACVTLILLSLRFLCRVSNSPS